MRKYILIVLVSIYTHGNAKNLVRNSSFDELEKPCNTSFGWPFVGLERVISHGGPIVKNWHLNLYMSYPLLEYTDVKRNGKLYTQNTPNPNLFLHDPNKIPIPQSRSGITHLAFFSTFIYDNRSVNGICTSLHQKEIRVSLVGNVLKDTGKTGDYCGFFMLVPIAETPFDLKVLASF